MLCHINPAAYTYKGSFTLYATPQKGREGHLNSVVVIAKPIWGHANGKEKRQGEKKVGSDKKNRRQRKKVNDSQIKIPKAHKNQTRTTNVSFLIREREIYTIGCRKSLFKAFCCMNKLQGCFK